MKKTKYLNGLVALSLGSVLTTGCLSSPKQADRQEDWINTDTVPGKVVHDNNGNEWIYHGGYHGGGLSNMLMGYWLINSMTGAQTRYYPSSRSYTGDMDGAARMNRPDNVTANPMKSREGMMNTVPTAAKPLNRAALKSGYAMPASRMQPVKSTSTRSGFGSTGSRGSRSVGA
ncbi:MAG: hypothetical protein ACRCSQ_06985 [Bacteroidales bacterium]